MTFWGDSGGKAAFSAPRPIVGARNVAAFILGVLQKVPGTLRTTPVIVNGQPGFIFATDFALGGVLALDIVDQHIRGIRFVANPDKLPKPVDDSPALGPPRFAGAHGVNHLANGNPLIFDNGPLRLDQTRLSPPIAHPSRRRSRLFRSP